MNFRRIALFELLKVVPNGKVVSYKEVAEVIKLPSARLVGRYLRMNNQKYEIPCYKVVRSDGSLASGYKFGGRLQQKKLLESEGIGFIGEKVEKDFFWRPGKVLREYLRLILNFGLPGDWPWFSEERYTKDEIIISSVLTQNTSWKNVERAMQNLRGKGANSLISIQKMKIKVLESLIRPAGFFRRKAKALKNLSDLILGRSYRYFEKSELEEVKEFLLSLRGIGKETADTILLYAFDRLIFVIDVYTIRFLRSKFSEEKIKNYSQAQKFFSQTLPKDLNLYKNYHALIVEAGKRGFKS